MLQLATDEGVKLALAAFAHKIAGVVNAVRQRRKKRAAETRDPERVKIDDERVRQVAKMLTATLEDSVRAGTLDVKAANAEASEPAFEEFVEDAFDAAANTTADAKRLLLASMIAERLNAKTDSQEETNLRRSLAIVRDLNKSQLLLLAAIMLVQEFPSPGGPPPARFGSRAEAETWLRKRFGSLVVELKREQWNRTDFEILSSLGAIRITGDFAIPGRLTSRADGIEQWLAQHEVGPYDVGPDLDPYNRDHHTRIKARFPTIFALKDIIAPKDGPKLDDVVLSPAGRTIASLLLERLLTSNSTPRAAGLALPHSKESRRRRRSHRVQ